MGLYHKDLELSNDFQSYSNFSYYINDKELSRVRSDYLNGYLYLNGSNIEYYNTKQFPKQPDKIFSLPFAENSNNYIASANNVIFCSGPSQLIHYSNDLGETWNTIPNSTGIIASQIEYINNIYCILTPIIENGGYYTDLNTINRSPLHFRSQLYKLNGYLYYFDWNSDISDGGYKRTNDFLTFETVYNYGDFDMDTVQFVQKFDYGCIFYKKSRVNSNDLISMNVFDNNFNFIFAKQSIVVGSYNFAWLPNGKILMITSNPDYPNQNYRGITEFDYNGSEKFYYVSENWYGQPQNREAYITCANDYVIAYFGTAWSSTQSMSYYNYELCFCPYDNLYFTDIKNVGERVLGFSNYNNGIAVVCSNGKYKTLLPTKNLSPLKRTKIFCNDYSTITGSQVLENAVRSVNHRIYKVSLKDNMEIGSKIVSDNYTSNPIYAVGEKLGGTKDRREIYILTGTATIKTDKPIIGDLTKSNFKFYYNNKECDFTGNNADFYNLMNNIDEQYYTGNTPFPIQLSDLSNIGLSINESGVKDISEWVKRLQFDTSNYINEITNIVKLDDYTVTFDYRLTTKYIFFSTLSGNNYSMVEYYQSKNINIVLSTISIDDTNDQFVFSIDTQNGEYVQNNPLKREDNELFSLSDTFFENQANAIIQANKDGRMILTVNSTSDLNLYLGKELQVELKDGTLANNGATFEVTGIKEKFTGINWKQTYTLKEKKNNT